MTYLIRDIPDELWRRVKSRAALEGEPVRTVVLRMLSKYAEEKPKAAKESKKKRGAR